MCEREISGWNRRRVLAAVKGNLFLAAAIVLTASSALAFGRIGEGIMQICIFFYIGTVTAVLYAMRYYVSKGEWRKLRNDAVGVILTEAVICFLMAAALLYAASLAVATFIPVSGLLKISSGAESMIARVIEAVSLATAGAVPASAAPKISRIIGIIAESCGAEKVAVILSIAVWTVIVCLFAGMLIRVASGILLVCSAKELRNAMNYSEGRSDLSVTAKYLTGAGIGIAICSGMPAGGAALILVGRALGRTAGDSENIKDDPGAEEKVSDEPLQ